MSAADILFIGGCVSFALAFGAALGHAAVVGRRVLLPQSRYSGLLPINDWAPPEPPSGVAGELVNRFGAAVAGLQRYHRCPSPLTIEGPAGLDEATQSKVLHGLAVDLGLPGG